VSADELVDIVDENDRVVRCVTRAEMRQRRLRHRCVYILLFDSNKRLFVHKRTHSKDVYPGWWDVAVGGVVGAGEDYDSAASREVEEEVGLSGVQLDRLGPITYSDPRTQVMGMIYDCTSDSPLRLQEAEIVEGRWVDNDGLVELEEREHFCPDGLVALAKRSHIRRCPAERLF